MWVWVFCCLFALGLIIAMERYRCSRNIWTCQHAGYYGCICFTKVSTLRIKVNDQHCHAQFLSTCTPLLPPSHNLIFRFSWTPEEGRKERREGGRKKLRNSVRLDANTKIPEHLFLSISSSEGERGKLQKQIKIFTLRN